jgi:amidophosphoribosyltransferase
MVFGQSVHDVRMRLGQRLAQEHPAQADLVTPIPDSGMAAALGYSHASGIPLDYGFIRNHYVGRTFIMPTQGQRSDSVDMKLAVVPGVVRGKRVVVVDDSLIRGTTSRAASPPCAKRGPPRCTCASPARPPGTPAISASISPPARN